MARRTMAYRRRRAAEREQRREVLAHLLSRSDRGVLTDTERPLLRAHVEAELRESDDLRRTINGQQRRIERFIAQLAAAHDAIREAEQDAADAREQLRAYRTAEAQRQDRATRIRAFLAEQTTHLNTPEPQPIECRNRFHIHQVTRPGPECQ
ncbi:hypothetical protein [Streptomyces sp. CB01580]|uniref:hypothetical protein n=1 Tax=Streptomyces sp. CB01580 TaxID=1703933 RepID=UPI000938CA7D|nr:hypothetical protein [Streptomyces sp. CB01580]OKJ42293.1 hypothetical protein AMK22_05120 [Streptomyces sp. CB01580]